ncbi:MAG: fructose 1,6-bisphosphatase, partial [Candidatus Omnitrophica bacterium]|nr:fructose 1,6-bisphosphatase [Candidatus Omnitrophota bacterium]
GLPVSEPIATVVYQPAFTKGGQRSISNPTIIYRSQSGGDAVGAIASMNYEVNFVPGGSNGENFVATSPISLEDARKRQTEEGVGHFAVYGYQSRDNGFIPMEKAGVLDHVGVNPPAVREEQRLARKLAKEMVDHQDDQPYLSPAAAEHRVHRVRKDQNSLFIHAPKESERDEFMDELEAKVKSGEYLAVVDDKADMGGLLGHTQVPLFMTAVYRATVKWAMERDIISYGNTFGSTDFGRLRDDENLGIGDDGHMILLGDKSHGSAEAHQLAFLAFTRAYLFSVANKMKPYGEGQDFAGAEAEAAKKNPYFYSKFDERFFEILREVMPASYLKLSMIEKVENGWREWRRSGQSEQLNEPFSGNVSQQGIGSARYILNRLKEKTFDILAGDKMGPAALNRVIKHMVYSALKAGKFKNGLVFEIWDAKAFDENGKIAIEDIPRSFSDIKANFQVDEKKLAKWKPEDRRAYEDAKTLVARAYRSGLLDITLTSHELKQLAKDLRKYGYVPTKRIFLDAEKDKDAIIRYLGDSDRFNVKHVWSKKSEGWDSRDPKTYLDRPLLASSVTRLGILSGGEYLGKDDPVMVGNSELMEYAYEFLKTHPLIIQGDMNGSHWLWAIVTALKNAVATKDSHPILVGMRYTLSEDGKSIVQVEDMMGGESFDPIRDRAFNFNREFKAAQLGGQFEPYGTNVKTVEAAYPLAKLLRDMTRADSPFLVANK